jgi:hypothetical protein
LNIKTINTAFREIPWTGPHGRQVTDGWSGLNNDLLDTRRNTGDFCPAEDSRLSDNGWEID